jgi:hypothetical protein
MSADYPEGCTSYCPRCFAEGADQSCREGGRLIDDHGERGLFRYLADGSLEGPVYEAPDGSIRMVAEDEPVAQRRTIVVEYDREHAAECDVTVPAVLSALRGVKVREYHGEDLIDSEGQAAQHAREHGTD